MPDYTRMETREEHNRTRMKIWLMACLLLSSFMGLGAGLTMWRNSAKEDNKTPNHPEPTPPPMGSFTGNNSIDDKSYSTGFFSTVKTFISNSRPAQSTEHTSGNNRQHRLRG